MSTEIVGGLGGYLSRVSVMGSLGAVVQDPETRRDLVVYGDNIIFDGDPRQVIGDVAVDATDIILSTSWQAIPGCVVTLPVDVPAGDMQAMVETQLAETASGTAVVELGLSKAFGVAPTAPSWRFTAIAADSDESYPSSCLWSDILSSGEALYLWIRATSGSVTVRGSYIPTTPDGAQQRTSKLALTIPFTGTGVSGSGGVVNGNEITGP